ncbi:ubiquitin-like domain-containing CTD phosphatase 1 [Gigantopelta aegis]|uniref:ubiquitin-like domain-containing CTD phosphatase 1 n=1 Tax=Gigantopelta aegis TaxID=1735272 RepID=UPI001B888390|nr:ubiquitin-like domain-containing CTD phosphatase 1 [Gigantopelta aegis]
MSEVGDLIVKFQKNEHKITGLLDVDTVADLKNAIYKATSVLPERQKLLGFKIKGNQLTDDLILSSLKLKPNSKIMLIGSTEDELAKVAEPPSDIPEVINDFDIEEEEIAIESREEFLSKVERRVKEYKIKILNDPRPGKKLLVLDIDYTLFDHRSVAENVVELMRPYLHEFLASAYADYDIVIWSATGMKWIETKMKGLGVEGNPNYKISFYLDSDAMISVHTPKYGVIEVKPLGVIWGKFNQWSAKNTIMFDDIRRNFIMNPQSGLKIRPFKKAHFNRNTDTELLELAKYLTDIAELDDFTVLCHKKWERYNKHKHSKPSRSNVDKSTGEKSSEDKT